MTRYETHLPPSGAFVRFSRVPLGSYATAGEVYEVTYGKSQRAGIKGVWSQTSVRLWNHERQCGTYDSAFNWPMAKWEIAQAVAA